MKYLAVAFNWLLCLAFFLFALSMLSNEDWLRAGMVAGIVLLLFPPLRQIIDRREEGFITRKGRLAAIVGLLMLLYLTGQMNRPDSIYDSAEHESRFMKKYDELMEDWPVPYTSLFVNTRLGRVHVIISGPKNAPPALLLHAGALPSWSWKYNIEGLSNHFRTFAIDAIGEVGKSALENIDRPTRDGKDVAQLYSEIMDFLEIEKAHIIGASYGGFIATNMALYQPQKVDKLVLLGPMGVNPVTRSTLLRIVLLTLFPAEPVQRSFVDWMIDGGNDNTEEIIEWMRLVFEGVTAREAMPTTFSRQQLQEIGLPVLLILGRKDNLVGKPEMVMDYTGNMPNLKTEILDTSHAIWAEEPERVNSLVLGFLN